MRFVNSAVKTKWTIKLKVIQVIPYSSGAVIIRFLHLYKHIIYQLLNILKIKSDNNQQNLKFADLHFVKSE